MTKEEKKNEEVLKNYWQKFVRYSLDNGYSPSEFIEELARVYHFEEGHGTLAELRKLVKDEKEFTGTVFSSLAYHGDWEEEHALDNALIHAHIRSLKKDGKLTLKQEKELSCSVQNAQSVWNVEELFLGVISF